jgi:hypothetical protein
MVRLRRLLGPITALNRLKPQVSLAKRLVTYQKGKKVTDEDSRAWFGTLLHQIEHDRVYKAPVLMQFSDEELWRLLGGAE